MDYGSITALAALAGSAAGGLTSGITTWISARSHARAGRLTGELTRRQDLFRDFMVAASKAYGSALTHSEPRVEELVELYALMSRMRVLCSPQIVACADRVLRRIIDTYFAPNRTVRELHELVMNGTEVDPLKEFSAIARDELKALTAA